MLSIDIHDSALLPEDDRNMINLFDEELRVGLIYLFRG